ncbi:hypothetical protein RHSIM_Rhsim08G0240000 [Rhododendron simsii]|uniref:Uncharacterized protein n=1 Tax=Rhododendron simsii TaxID=118357 RepID=A0A834GHN0_RHOSS|nr:hypothetical protein RHSIM_Rhsim08G0240000 [Rhododendron simsii]
MAALHYIYTTTSHYFNIHQHHKFSTTNHPQPMETPWWTTYAAAWLATATLLLLSTTLRRRRKLNLPPGPTPWPIIGNLNLIGSLPHRSLDSLSQKYGPIMHLRLGSFPVVVGSSVDLAKVFLKTMDVTFASRPKTAAGKYTTYNYSDITWSPYGPYWRQARRMCLMELFSTKRLESYEYIRVEEMKALLKELHGSAGEPVMLKNHLSTVSLNVISRMVLGKRFFLSFHILLYLDEAENAIVEPMEFKKMLDELFLLNGVLNIGDSIPWLDFMDLQGYVKRMKIVAKKFDRFLEHVLDEHNARKKEEAGNFVAKDMVDVLLQFAEDPNLEIKLERHGVKAFTQAFRKNNELHSPPPMETPSWTTYAAAWLATATLLLLSTTLRLCRHRKLNLPPGPTPWPIIGNLNLIGSLPHRSLDSLSQKYGPIMHLRFGSFPVVIGSSVDMAKVFLKTMDVTFASRPKTAAGKYTTYNYSNITWSPYGPYWRQARRMCLMELFSAKRLESFKYIRVEEMKALLKKLHGSAGEPVMLKNHLSTVSLNIISRMVLGKRYYFFSFHIFPGPDLFVTLLNYIYFCSASKLMN